jgi:hypothetical protein
MKKINLLKFVTGPLPTKEEYDNQEDQRSPVVGLPLKHYRELAGFSIDEVEVHTNNSNIAKYESGELTPRIEALKQLTKLYNIGIQDLHDFRYRNPSNILTTEECGIPTYQQYITVAQLKQYKKNGGKTTSLGQRILSAFARCKDAIEYQSNGN